MNSQNWIRTGKSYWHSLISIAFLIPLSTWANESITTELLDSFAFESEIAAVKAIKENCLAESKRENAEHMGAILQTGDGQFLVTHGKAAPEQESVTFTIKRPASSRLIALWHTHGAPGRKTERFSITDGKMVRETGLPFYLITPKGEIKVLEKAVKGQSGNGHATSRAIQREYVRKFRDLALYRVI